MNIFTDWFPPEVKPVHVGLYECRCCYQKYWWDGTKWWIKSKTVRSAIQKISWRGLKEKPE